MKKTFALLLCILLLFAGCSRSVAQKPSMSSQCERPEVDISNVEQSESLGLESNASKKTEQGGNPLADFPETSSSQEEKHAYHTYSTDLYNGWSGGIIELEENEMISIPKEKTIIFEGSELTGQYSSSGYSICGPQYYHQYFLENGMFFGIDPKTDDWIELHAMGYEELFRQDDFPTLITSEAEAIDAAISYANGHVDIENYQEDHVFIVDYGAMDPTDMYFKIYFVYFIRMLGNLPTTDEVIVGVTDKGFLVHISRLNTHAFDEVTEEQIRELEAIDIQAVLDEYVISENGANPQKTINSLRVTDANEYSPGYQVTFTPDGELGIVVTAEIQETWEWSVDDSGKPVEYSGYSILIIK